MQDAIQETSALRKCRQLADECAKLDPAFEKAMAEGVRSEEWAAWPQYGQNIPGPSISTARQGASVE